jgi:ribosomal-protein-serine acetyltransferase
VDFTTSVEDTSKFIQECQDGFKDKKKADFGIMLDGVWVGSGGFHTIKSESGWGEIGYWRTKDKASKGIMDDCVKAMIDYGFNELGLHRIQIQCDADNVPSKLIPERLGFKPEGVIRENHKKEGRYSDGLIYGLLKSEWK